MTFLRKRTRSRKTDGAKGLKRLRDRILVASARAAIAVIPRLSLEACQRLGDAVGVLVSAIPGRRTKRTYEHLAIAYPIPPATRAQHRRYYRGAWKTFFKLVLEAVWAKGWRTDRDHGRVRIAQPEVFDAVFSHPEIDRRGLVIFTAHLGSMELLSRWVKETINREIMVIAGKPKVPELESLMADVRGGGGVRMVYRGDAGVAAIRHLRRGGIFVLFADHNLKGEGVELPVFGKPAHTLIGPARLALQSGALATTLFCLRDGLGRLVIDVDPLIELPPKGDTKEEKFAAEVALTREYLARIEAAIRRYPEQYLWMHRRWLKRNDSLPLPPSL